MAEFPLTEEQQKDWYEFMKQVYDMAKRDGNIKGLRALCDERERQREAIASRLR